MARSLLAGTRLGTIERSDSGITEHLNIGCAFDKGEKTRRLRGKMRIAATRCIGLCLMAWNLFGQQVPGEVPDEIFYNGKIITVDSAFSIQQAFAVKGEEILAVGSTTGIRDLAGPSTRLTDLRGHTVIPGLMDNHNHQYNAALVEYRGVDLHGITSLAEMFKRIRQAAATLRAREPVITSGGWTEGELAEKRGPTRQELDEVAGDRIVIVQRARGTAYANSAALKAAGITRDTDFIVGNQIQKDAFGEPTGLLNIPSTVNLVVPRVVPLPPLADQVNFLSKVQDRQLAMGLTSIRELELKPEGMRAYQALRRTGKLKMRVSMGLDVNATDWDKLDQILTPWGVGPAFGDHWLRLDSISEFAVDSATPIAFFREPKLDPPGERGGMRVTPEQLRQAMVTINRYGWRPAPHITGDATLDKVLDAYEAANAEASIRDRRWVVEHIPFVHPDQMDRMARMGVVVSAQFQPYNSTEASKRVLGPERADYSLPMRDLLDHKLIVSAGSDFAGGTYNPFVNIYFYVTRKTSDGRVTGASQKISRQEALRVATVNNAYLTFEEDAKGSLGPGKLADFLILSDDVLTIPDDKILQIKPLATYVGARKMYSAPNSGF